MNIRTLLLAGAMVAAAGVSSGVMAAEESVMVKPSWNSMRDGAPPPLESSSEPSSESAAGVKPSEASRTPADEKVRIEADKVESQRRASRTKDEIMNEQSDEQIEQMKRHNQEVYGNDEGPFTELEKQEQLAIEAKKKVAVYGMTYAEREAMLKAEAEAEKNAMKPSGEAVQQKEPTGGYIYNRKKTSDAPPRLFNNVTR